MRVESVGSYKRSLAQGAALIVIAGFASGCSSDAMRFGGVTDGIFTASTANQRAIIAPGDQPYPAESVAAAPVAAAPIDGSHTGSLARGAVEPATGSVSRTALAPPTGSSAAPAATSAPVTALAPVSESKADLRTTASVEPIRPAKTTVVSTTAPAEENTNGWSRAGGTQVTVKDGETIYNLAKRFGVPAKSIMSANGITEANGLKAGQKVVIPTYVYSRSAPVSMPDADPAVADAKSSTGTKYDVPAGKVPVPAKSDEKVAVLANPPKLREPDPASTSAASTTSADAKKPVAGTYTVSDGDSLARIAKKTGTTVSALKEANGLSDGVLRIGQTLKLPGGTATATKTVASNEPLKASDAKTKVDPISTGSAGPAKATTSAEVSGYTPPKKADKAVAEAAEEEVASIAPDSSGISRMRWPVRGRVIANYGKGSGKANDGIDIAVPEGTTVKAAENGVVIYAGDGLKDFGNTVLVRHESGLVTVYGHAGELKVARGDKVKRGQEIATSGMSGNAETPKLHFEVRKDSTPVDPSRYLE